MASRLADLSEACERSDPSHPFPAEGGSPKKEKLSPIQQSFLKVWKPPTRSDSRHLRETTVRSPTDNWFATSIVPTHSSTKTPLYPKTRKSLKSTHSSTKTPIYPKTRKSLKSPNEVVAGEDQVLHVRLRHGVVAHGTRLRVVVR